MKVKNLNKLYLKLINLVRSDIPGSFEDEQVRKTVVVNLFSLVGMFFLTLFAIKAINTGLYIHAIILFIADIIIFLDAVYLRLTKNYNGAAVFMVLVLMLLELYFLVSTSPGEDLYLWYYVFPALCLFSLDSRKGSIFVFTLLAITIVLFVIEPDFMYKYERNFKFRFISSNIALFIMVYVFERVRAKTYHSLVKTNEKKSYYLVKVLEQKKQILVQAKQLELKNEELEKLSIAASKTDNAIVIMDAEGNFEWVNEGFTRKYNLTFDEFITKRGKNILEYSGNPDIKNALTKCINEKITVNYEYSYQKEAKEDIWVQTTITPILNDNGDISKLIAIDSDITDIKKAEKEIIRQRDEITDSIIYSKHIQNAILPTDEYIKQILPNSFIFYKPKEIIGGDFFWVFKQGDKIIIAVADCTGHGVPGALMSMIGITFLNEIIINMQITDPADILDLLRIRVIKALHQSEDDESSKDGMDVALCVINTKLNILEYAGANNPLLIIRNNELTELSPDKMPVSIYRMNGRHFQKKEIKIQSGNLIYLFSDGYADQFGGPHNKKLRKINFKQLLLDISILPINEQLKKISISFNNWCGNQEQVDDVIVMGIKVD